MTARMSDSFGLLPHAQGEYERADELERDFDCCMEGHE